MMDLFRSIAFLNFDDLVTIVAIFFTLVIILKVFSKLLGESAAERRLRELHYRKKEMLDALEEVVEESSHYRLKRLTWQEKIFQMIKGLTESEASKYQIRLEQAGYYTQNASYYFIALKFVFMVVGVLIGIIAFFILQLAPTWGDIMRVGGIIGCGVIGSLSLDYFIGAVINKRMTRIQSGFADTLDIMVIATEAGLSLDHTLERVANEIGQVNYDLGRELGITSIELSLMPDRKMAFNNFVKRVDLPVVRDFVTTLIQAEQQGTSIAQTLRSIADESRRARMFKAEARAARLPAIMTIPLILFVLPTLFIVLMGPAILGAIRTFGGMGH